MRRYIRMALTQDPLKWQELSLIEEAKKSSKKIISLCSKEERDQEYLSHFKDIFENPFLFDAFKILLLPKDEIEDVSLFFNERGKAWDLGAVSPSIEIPFCSDERDHVLTERLKNKHNYTEKEFSKVAKKNTKKLIASQLERAKGTADKIAALLAEEKDLLILHNETSHQELFSVLSARKIEPIGPIRSDLKPRGFLFEIKKVNTVVGYFLGSIHITPDWILENFNSKIYEAFAYCDVLGVEVDVTREGLREEFHSESAIPKEKAALMREFTAIGLKDMGLELEEADDNAYIIKGFEMLQSAFGLKSGIDLAFIKMAKERKIEVIDLESAQTHKDYLNLEHAEQAKMADRFPKATAEVLYLAFKQSLLKQVSHDFPFILETGCIKAVEGAFLNGQSETKRVAMNARNMEMAMNTHLLITQKKKPFSIAGAAHFAGEKSMIKYMEDLGYTVTQIICEEPKNI